MEKYIRNEFLKLAEENQLQNYEIPQQLFLNQDEWNVENELITTIGKPCRPKLKLK